MLQPNIANAIVNRGVSYANGRLDLESGKPAPKRD